MAKLGTLKPKLGICNPNKAKPLFKPGAGGSSHKRMSGSKLQARRLRMWSHDPHCAVCGRVTAYPSGFELDHKIALSQGGEDTEQNCQILCVWYDEAGNKQGCHIEKSNKEAGVGN